MVIEQINRMAGRNLFAAIFSGLAFITVMVLSLVFDPRPFVLFVMFISIVVSIELFNAFRTIDVHPPIVLISVGIVFIEGTAFLTSIDLFIISTFVTIFVIFIYCCVSSREKYRYKNSLAGTFIILYVPFLLSFLFPIINESWGEVKIALCAVPVVAADTGAWAIGKFLGKHKFSKVLSPNKTIEGVVGSFIFSSIVTFVFIFFIPNPYKENILVAVVLSFLAPIIGLFGDLAESVIKRAIGWKDMGDVLVGHGGFLDRIDSVLFMIPAFYFFTQFLF